MNAPETTAATTPALFPAHPPALLALADGTTFRGRAIGAHGHAIGEVVFNTAMTGYQEILTDPSYAGQIITFTYPHIGNYGVNERDDEARAPRCRGVIVRDMIRRPSNWLSRIVREKPLSTRSIWKMAKRSSKRCAPSPRPMAPR